MKYEIKRRWNGTVLFSLETDSLKLAIEAAIKSGASLRNASLDGASLDGASLRNASLDGASLDGASLDDASLDGARGVTPERVTPLLMLFEQPGPIRAYKLVTGDGIGPYNGGITYRVGKSYEVADANTNPLNTCGRGINLATLDWCLRKWKPGFRVLIMEFTAADIAAIPTATDGKFRVFRGTVVGEKSLAGLVPDDAEVEAK